MKSRIYTGNVMHARMEPVRHTFQYPVYMYVFDLDELPALDQEISWFGYNRIRPVSIHDKDYLHEGSEPIKQKLIGYLQKYNVAENVSRVELLTSARYFHYIFNPVSFYYCYTADESIACIVAEVNNTFDERHVYVLDKPGEVTADHTLRYIRPKTFHVSPFNDMNGEYDFYFGNLNGTLDIRINIIRDNKPSFLSRLSGKSIPFTSKNLTKTILRYPITAWLNMPRILKEAAMLYYQKRLPVFSKPHPTSDMTIRIAKPTFWQNLAMQSIFTVLEKLQEGSIRIELPDQSIMQFGKKNSTPAVTMKVNHYRFFTKVLRNGDIGFGESYVDGDWETPDLTSFLMLLIYNKPYIKNAFLGKNILGRAVHRMKHALNKNTKKGSRKNIHNHYDIGNDFYQLFLDPTMLYSSAIFKSPDESLESAQKNKMHALIEKARIQSLDHVLEIGSGWGGMAVEMVKKTGCRVTTITVSEEQYKFTLQRVKEEKVQNHIAVKLCDYRNIQGQFDKIISIEMIEAVGHEYLGKFFAACDQALKPNGIMVFQAITIPDQRYNTYRKRSDWIQQYIFPGAVIPSLTALCNAMTTHSSLIIDQIDNIGLHYAHTLYLWRQKVMQNKKSILELGMDETFIRMWLYYFTYCEAAFATRHLNNLQIAVTRQDNRLLTTNK